MNSHIPIVDAYKNSSFTERLYLFCEYRDLREKFLEIERTAPHSQGQPGTGWNYFRKLLSALSISV